MLDMTLAKAGWLFLLLLLPVAAPLFGLVDWPWWAVSAPAALFGGLVVLVVVVVLCTWRSI